MLNNGHLRMAGLMLRAIRAVKMLAVGLMLAAPVMAHGGHAIVGEIQSIAADSFEIRTTKETVIIKLSAKTIFELKKKPVDASHLQKGDRVSVTTAKLPNGSLTATKIILGLPKP